jgi:hypothetical protein
MELLHRARLRAALGLLPLLCLCACQGVRTLTDPTLVIYTRGGSELGVSTDYGIVFLGHTADSGPAQISVWYGDGPSLEKTIIEPIGHGLYTAELEILPPRIPLSFDEPAAGSKLLVIGRNGEEIWKEEVTVQEDPRVMGIITTIPERLQDAADQIGAGVYVLPEGDELRRKLVGLVSGRMTIEGSGKEYLTIVGPTELWRLVAHRREATDRRRWVYREDIL